MASQNGPSGPDTQTKDCLGAGVQATPQPQITAPPQSWFHSQEVNDMLDSPDVCAAWTDGLRRNQNTHLYGALDKTDGLWRDVHGKAADGAIGIDPGRFAWARGVTGAVKRA